MTVRLPGDPPSMFDRPAPRGPSPADIIEYRRQIAPQIGDELIRSYLERPTLPAPD